MSECNCGKCKACVPQRGERGLRGKDGAKGGAGAQGPQGPAGNNGNNGLQGPEGPQGPAGTSGSVSSKQEIYKEAESGTFQVPPGVTELIVEIWGGGAGASIYKSPEEIMLIAGGGGGYIKTIIVTSPGSIIPYTVGAGGSSLPSGATTIFIGSEGYDTVFGSITAKRALAHSLILGTPNILVPSRGGQDITIDEDITGGTGEVVLLRNIAGLVYVDGQAQAGSAAKNGMIIESGSSVYTTVSGFGFQNNAGDGGACSYYDQAGNPAYKSGFGRDGRIVVRWEE